MNVQRSPVTSKTLPVFSLLCICACNASEADIYSPSFNRWKTNKQKLQERTRGKRGEKKRWKLINMPECKYFLFSWVPSAHIWSKCNLQVNPVILSLAFSSPKGHEKLVLLLLSYLGKCRIDEFKKALCLSDKKESLPAFCLPKESMNWKPLF